MNTVYKTNKLTYKREEISNRLTVLIELKNTIGYSVAELTEALGYKGDLVYKALKNKLPVSDEMYNRAYGLLELSKTQQIRGREWELISRINIITAIGKKISLERLSERLGEDKKYISNYLASGRLIGDELYKQLSDIYRDILEAEDKEREEKRLARIFKISDVIDELIEEVNRLELLENIEEIEDYYSEINSKKRAIKRLKELEAKGVKEVTPNGIGYMAVR